LIKSILALVTACILVSYVSEGTANAQTVQQVCVSVKFSANEPYPLHGAAFLGCVDAARELIEKGLGYLLVRLASLAYLSSLDEL
jgi:hypothetical protein